MTRYQSSRRWLAVLLAVLLVIGMMPTTVWADSSPVAYIGASGYTSLGAAVSAASAGDAIVLAADDTTTQRVTISKDLSIELDGHSLPNTAIKITAGTVDIGDRKGTGVINENNASGFQATEGSTSTIQRCASTLHIVGTAEVTLNNLRVEQCAEDDLEKAIFLGQSARLTINGGSYTAVQEAGTDALFFDNTNKSSSLTINDGYFEGQGGLSVNQTPGTGGTLVIRKATFVGNGTAFWIEEGGGGVNTQEKAERFLSQSQGSYIVPPFHVSKIVVGSGLFVSEGFAGPEYGSTDPEQPAVLPAQTGDSITLLPQILGGDGSDYTYVWTKDGAVIDGADGPSYTFAYTSPEDEGTYTVTVSQAGSSITLYWKVGQTPSTSVSYDLWVGGTQVTAQNASDILGDGAVRYDPDTHTLTLDNATLDAGTHTGYSITAPIFADDAIGDLTVQVRGENHISLTHFGGIAAGIYAHNNITFQGDGSLEVYALSLGSEGSAVYAHMGDVTIQSGAYTFEGDGTTGSYGIFANANQGTTFVHGGTLTAIGGRSNVGTAVGGALDFSSYENSTIISSAFADGSNPIPYDPENTSYKYIKIDPPPAVPPVYDENGFQTNGEGYQPAQLADGVYQIENAGNLFWFAQTVKASGEGTVVNAVLTRDITIPQDRAWTPISVDKPSTTGVPYTGTFDGAGHTIGGLTTDGEHGGLFKSIGADGVVKNLGLVDGSFTGGADDYVGAIAGSNSGTIENCYNTGSVTGQSLFTGGIVGENKGTILECRNTGTVAAEGLGQYGGGICGVAKGDAVIENCCNTGSISGTWGISGICGSFYENTVSISNCYNTGTVTIVDGGYQDTAHGIAYANQVNYPASVDNCYYLADQEDESGGKTDAQFASGQVTWQLNDEQSSGVWGQTLGADSAPVLHGDAVYAGYEHCYSEFISYSNDADTVHTTKPSHDFSDLEHDATSHWYACTNQGCTATSEPEEHAGGTASYFHRAVCEVCEQEYGAVLTDTTPPTGEISMGTNLWTTFLHTITFQLFFSDTQTVEITSTDDSHTHQGFTQEQTETVEYYLHSGDSALTKAELEEKTFTPYSGPFSLSPDDSYVVYVKLTDHAGNVTYLSSDGLVIDATPPAVEGVTHGAACYTSQRVTVTDTNLNSVTLNGQPVGETFTLTGNMEAEYVIVATDAAGNQTTCTVTMKPIASLASSIMEITADTVTSPDRTAIQAVQDAAAAAVTAATTPEEQEALDAITTHCAVLTERLEAATQAAQTEHTSKVESVTADSVAMENKEDLMSAKEDLEAALQDYGSNYTQAEQAALTEQLEQINSALQSIETVQTTQDAITVLPETVEPDDTAGETAIKAAKQAYDALTQHEKSLVPATLQAKLESLLADLVNYRIISGNGSQRNAGGSASITMTANGAVEKFLSIRVDGKEVDPANYTVQSGSTIITLKSSFLNELGLGEHTLTVVYTDGETSGVFEVLETGNPDTGDTAQLGLWTALLLVTACALMAVKAHTRSRQHN